MKLTNPLTFLRPKRLAIILGGVLLVVLAVGVVAWQLQMLPVNAKEGELKPPTEAEVVGLGFPVKEQTINLADTNVARYMKIEVVLDFEAEKGVTPKDSGAYKKALDRLREELTPLTPKIEDRLIYTMSSKKSSELLSQAGKEMAKQELIEQIQPVVGERKLLNVYFRQFIIQ